MLAMAAPLLSSGTVPNSSGEKYAQLKPYQFQPGHGKLGGRVAGTPNALTVILDSAPRKARQYVKSTAPAVLVDARKWIMPIDSDAPTVVNVELLSWMERRAVAADVPQRQRLEPPMTMLPVAETSATSETQAASMLLPVAAADTASRSNVASQPVSVEDGQPQRQGIESPTPPRAG